MLVLGRLSSTSVLPLAKVAGPLPPLLTTMVQVQGVPRVVVWLTLSVLVALRSGAPTVTVSVKVLLASLLSGTTLLGSTEAKPLLRGLAKVPGALGVAVKDRVTEPPEGRTTLPPLAVAVRSLL